MTEHKESSENPIMQPGFSALGPWSGRLGEIADDKEIMKKLGVTDPENRMRSPHWAFDRHQTERKNETRGYLTVADDYEGTRWKFRSMFNPPKVTYDFRVGADRFVEDLQAGGGAEAVLAVPVRQRCAHERRFVHQHRRRDPAHRHASSAKSQSTHCSGGMQSSWLAAKRAKRLKVGYGKSNQAWPIRVARAQSVA